MSEDPYTVLGVGRDATDAEIKRQYRKLARQHHPDRNPDDAAAEEMFKSIQAAYDKVGTKDARSRYDESKRMEDFFQNNPRNRNSNFSGFEVPDIFSQMFGGSRQQRNKNPSREKKDPDRGSDIRSGIDLEYSEAETGGRIEFDHQRLRLCPSCKGSSFATTRTCGACNGRGVRSRRSTIIVKIPPESKHGQKIRMKGLGHDHPVGVAGDLILTIRIDAKEGRRWESGRLIQSVCVPYSMLILGGKCSVKTPSGSSIRIEVEPGTQIGDRRRIPNMSYGGDDLDIEFTLKESEEITETQREILKRLRMEGL
tara:strand:+ start:2797 stop:3729 length:933 start_codon:yes stop_codon:yes gene_type:complete